MVKIEKLVVENYKNIEKAEFNLGGFNVIVGENNSGKSNLLEVLPFLNYVINGSIDEIKSLFGTTLGRIGLFDYVFTSPEKTYFNPLKISIDYSSGDKIYYYQIWLSKNEGPNSTTQSIQTEKSTQIIKEEFRYKIRSVSGKAREIFNREANSISYGEGITKTEVINELPGYSSGLRLLKILSDTSSFDTNYKEAITILHNILASPIFYFSNHLLKGNTKQETETSRVSNVDIEDEIAKIKNTSNNKWNLLTEALRFVLKIDDIEVEDLTKLFNEHNNDWIEYNFRKANPAQVLFLHSNKGKRIIDFSDGTVLLIALITKVIASEQPIFLIEEPENSVHPKALQNLIRFMQSYQAEKQFIITTHSGYILNMVKPEEIIVANLNNNGMSKINNIPNVKELKKQLSKGFMEQSDLVFFPVTETMA